MKKWIAILIVALLLVGCSKSPLENNQNNSIVEKENDHEVIEQSSSDTKDEIESVTFEPDNEYIKITSIDTSACKHENGYYSGNLYYVVETTQKYIDEYGDYFFREFYFGFYNEKGVLVGEEITHLNCSYDRPYVSEGRGYVLFQSQYNISEVKLLKIVCYKS